MKIGNLILSAVLLLTAFPTFIFAQKKLLAGDIEIGTFYSTQKDIRSIYGPGVKILAGPKISLLQDQQLWLRLHGGVDWAFKEIQEENSVTDHLRAWKAGMQLQYQVLQKKIGVSLFGEANYNWVSNYYSAIYNYNWYNNTADIKRSEKYLKGKAVSFGAGGRIAFDSRWFARIGYEYFRPKLEVHPEIIRTALQSGYIVPEEYSFNLSSFNLCIGYQLNLSK